VASSSLDTTIRLWETETGRTLAVLEGHKDGVTSCGFSPDGNRLVSASIDGTIKLWNARTGQLLASYPCQGDVHCCAFNPKNTLIACGDSGGNVYLLDPIGFGFTAIDPKK